jgi:general nucleoside transport system ATP-binding protein
MNSAEGESSARVGAPGDPPGPYALEIVGIDKRFGPVHANRNLHLAIPKGSIHGIIGENGAGKSTLMNIVYGFYRADSGEIRVDGRPVDIAEPAQAIRTGIGMVHQHFMLVDNLTVLENLVLGVESGELIKPSLDHARAEIARLARDYGLEVPPDTPVGELPVGVRQRIEILKALYRGAEILILDEPTGVLTPQETTQLFRLLATLRSQGKTILLITHKLREIMAITDRVTVMRQGAIVGTLETPATSERELAELMVGRPVLLQIDKQPARPGEVVLAVEKLTVFDRDGIARVKEVSFTTRAGEIVGIAGVSGNGQSELMEAIAGIRPVHSGRILYKGQDVTGSVHAAWRMRALGAAHVPEDRTRMGLVAAFAAFESSILGYHDRPECSGRVWVRRDQVLEDTRRRMRDFDVRPQNEWLRTASFSGGNQQKLILAREIDRDPDFLLIGQPTVGVDIGAVEFIHRQLLRLRDRGKSILLISAELDEVTSLSDRILVMFAGRVVGEVAGGTANDERIGMMMAGVTGEAA